MTKEEESSQHDLERHSSAILKLSEPSEDFSKDDEKPVPAPTTDDEKAKEKIPPDNISGITPRSKLGDTNNETNFAPPTELIRNERGNGIGVQPVGAFAVNRRISNNGVLWEGDETEVGDESGSSRQVESRRTITAMAISAEDLENTIRENILAQAVKAEAVDVEAQNGEGALQGAKEEELMAKQKSAGKRRKRLWLILFVTILALIGVAVTLGIVLRNRSDADDRDRKPPKSGKSPEDSKSGGDQKTNDNDQTKYGNRRDNDGDNRNNGKSKDGNKPHNDEKST